jgi:glycosidase
MFLIQSQYQEHSRDPERSPMQWNDTLNAGFTNGTPWLHVNHDYQLINVKVRKETQLYRVINFKVKEETPGLHVKHSYTE